MLVHVSTYKQVGEIMNKFKNIIVLFMALLLSSVMVSSCATHGVDLVANEKVVVEKVSSPSAYFSKTSVYSTDSKMTVSGELRKRRSSKGHIFGHVEIEVLSPDDTVLCIIDTSYHRRSLKSSTSIFSVDMPLKVEDGTTVRIIHHQDAKSKEKEKCA